MEREPQFQPKVCLEDKTVAKTYTSKGCTLLSKIVLTFTKAKTKLMEKSDLWERPGPRTSSQCRKTAGREEREVKSLRERKDKIRRKETVGKKIS